MAHAFVHNQLHIIFHIGEASPPVHDALIPELCTYMAGVVKGTKCEPIIINGTGNHIHALVNIHPTVCLADVVKNIKLGGSKWLKGKAPVYKDFYWQRGYMAMPVDISAQERIKEYIRLQQEHHINHDFEEEYLFFFNRNFPGQIADYLFDD